MAKRVKRVCAMDLISSLPHGILHRIISFLPKKDALRMSVLSSTWKHVLHTYPVLDFSSLDFGEDQGVYPLQPGSLTKETNPKLWEILDKLINYVDHSMLRFSKYEFTLQKFSLFIQLPDLKLASLLDKWVLLALEKGVKEFHLSVETPRAHQLPGSVYVLPKPVFAATSITVLKLYGCHLEECFSLKWHSLKMLELAYVCIHDHEVRELVTCCPLIEDLSFKECCGLRNVKIFCLSRLKKFSIMAAIHLPESVEISSPSLEFVLCGYKSKAARTVKVGSCPSLETLLCRGCFIPEKLLGHLDSKFPVLRTFGIRDCQTSERVKISSRSLKNLVIGSCDAIVDIEFDTPNLGHCNYYGSVAPTSVVNAPSCLWRIDFVLNSPIDIQWYSKLKEFLAKLNQLVYLHIYIQAAEIAFNVGDLITNASPSTIQDLAVTLDPEYPISKYAVFLDALFKFYRPKNLFIRSAYTCDIYVKYLCESLQRGRLSCCNHGNVRCWTHDLKEVKVESFGEDAQGKFPHNKHIVDSLPKERSHACCKMEWKKA